MLILSRKADETIVIGEEVEITILSIRGSQVKLGIQAPQEVDIFRTEILEEMREDNTAMTWE
ncbi:carbon storage regulator CsrA [Thiolapillus sp.]|uniref:carbon storage regulator CsrA n=1 Tax=Thiolapillus sp. TaxID=2017437 RepID=UPI0025DEE419|nr:carbon storage regulator CsrA [Thiolapillus sp.]